MPSNRRLEQRPRRRLARHALILSARRAGAGLEKSRRAGALARELKAYWFDPHPPLLWMNGGHAGVSCWSWGSCDAAGSGSRADDRRNRHWQVPKACHSSLTSSAVLGLEFGDMLDLGPLELGDVPVLAPPQADKVLNALKVKTQCASPLHKAQDVDLVRRINSIPRACPARLRKQPDLFIVRMSLALTPEALGACPMFMTKSHIKYLGASSPVA